MKKSYLAPLILAASFAVSAQDFKYEGLNYSVISSSEHTAAVTKNMMASGNVTIPQTVVYSGVNYTVTSISDGAFLWSDITGVTMPSTIKSIEANAFGMTAITSVVIPDGVTAIGKQAFNSCSELSSVTLPPSLVTIEESAFNTCGKLTAVTLPEKVESIGDKAFIACSALAELKLPASVKTIGAQAFKDCASLTTFTVPAATVSLGEGFLSGCTALTTFEVAQGNTAYAVKDNILYNADLTELILCMPFVSEAVTAGTTVKISPSAFDGCSKLTSLELNDGLLSIGDYAFYGTGLTVAVIPNSVTAIGESIFGGCKSLIQTNIGNNVTEIPYQTFKNCAALTAVQLGASIAKIGQYAFDGCVALKSIEIPDATKSIEEGAFTGCGKLTSLILGAGLEKINDYAFYDTGLSNITCLGSKPATVAEEGNFTEDMYYDAFLTVPAEAKSAYTAAVPWKYFEQVKTLKYDFEIASVSPASGKELRALKDISVTFNSLDKEQMPYWREDAYKAVTLAKDGGEPVYPTQILPYEEENITTIVFTFPVQTAAGKYTFTLPAGMVREVEWSIEENKYIPIEGKNNAAFTATYTINPEAKTVFSNYELKPATRTTLARLSTIGLYFPDAEYALDIDPELEITLTRKIEGEEDAVYYGVIGGWGNRRTISFEDASGKNYVAGADGKDCTLSLNIPQGVFSQNGVSNDRIRATYYIDAKMEAVYSTDPENGAVLALPEGYVSEITFDFYNSVTVNEKAAIDGASIKVRYGNEELPKIANAIEAFGWQLIDNYGEPAVTIRVGSEVFKESGVLTIEIDRGAFTIDGNPSPAISWKASYGETGGLQTIVTDNPGNDVIYNLQGIKVSSDFKSLPTGIYIVNGKKIIR